LPRELLPFAANDAGYLAFIGRISPEKRPDRAIEISARCGLPLKIAAKVDKADAAYWRDVIEPMVRANANVEYIGEINEAQKASFLGGARALLFPIDWEEPFGLVMIEALACGTPVIAFRRGSVPEVIDHGVSGYVVEDVDQAVQAVGMLDALERRRVGAAFDQRFTVERMARDYIELYRARAAASRHWPSARPQLTAVSAQA
jgi:glycosyltransferase involved in cell wall biosynthesis